ncbi:hypothetical protein STPH1_7572 [Streptomyces sp. OM5714]|nr:hypothetical protein STPH1_7572 [Streptomyces sp. OM5714]
MAPATARKPRHGSAETRRAEAPELHGPPGRAAEPPTDTSHASLLLIVTAETARDSEPLLLPTTGTGPRHRTRSELSHECRVPRSGDFSRRRAHCCQLLVPRAARHAVRVRVRAGKGRYAPAAVAPAQGERMTPRGISSRRSVDPTGSGDAS